MARGSRAGSGGPLSARAQWHGRGRVGDTPGLPGGLARNRPPIAPGYRAPHPPLQRRTALAFPSEPTRRASRMAIVPCPETNGPPESSSVTDIADGNGNARSTGTREKLRELLDDIRGHNRSGGYRAEYIDYTGVWAVTYTFLRSEYVLCYMKGTSMDRGDDQDQGKIDAEAIAALLNAASTLLDENDRLRANITWWDALATHRQQWIDDLKVENERLKAALAAQDDGQAEPAPAGGAADA